MFVLAIKDTDRDILTMIAFIIVLLFNWVTLKEIDGLKITTKKNQTILRISTLVVAFIILLNLLLLLSSDYGSGFEKPVMIFLIGLKLIFVMTVSYHAIKSRQLTIAD